ncbi:MAG TPA: hypothetical protein VFK02_00850 [Kofleriaceae bacterium]|nr:hypothetical protein [Kofleriaceae bacterium]
MPASDPELAAALNQRCDCITVDDLRLDEALRREAEGLGSKELIATHPHLFSRCAVFVDADTSAAMQGLVAAVERVVALPAYVERALADAHPHARVETPCRGVFTGFDFHLGTQGPRLIEINTNAGGGLLNSVLRRAQRACCEPVANALGVHGATEDLFAMFRDEWQLARGDRPLRAVAIVDDDPEQQYLYPEFVLFRALIAARGISAVICDARSLEIANGSLCHQGEPIDLVYNRLTDFALDQPEHAALAEAFRRDLAVVTPHPRAYALYADKRRLALLSDAAALRALGVPEPDIEILTRHVPRTQIVRPELRDQLWHDRKQLFFKPQSGYGGKAAYRGDSITRRVFEHVMTQPYVAQELVPPSVRTLHVGAEPRELKVDIRNYTYAGRTQLLCARLYHGQTTNFRSEGGGFAPVYVV